MCATSGALPQLLQQPSQITSHPSQIATTKTCMHHTKHSYFFTLQGYDPRSYKVIVLPCSQLGSQCMLHPRRSTHLHM